MLRTEYCVTSDRYVRFVNKFAPISSICEYVCKGKNHFNNYLFINKYNLRN